MFVVAVVVVALAVVLATQATFTWHFARTVATPPCEIENSNFLLAFKRYGRISNVWDKFIAAKIIGLQIHKLIQINPLQRPAVVGLSGSQATHSTVDSRGPAKFGCYLWHYVDTRSLHRRLHSIADAPNSLLNQIIIIIIIISKY